MAPNLTDHSCHMMWFKVQTAKKLTHTGFCFSWVAISLAHSLIEFDRKHLMTLIVSKNLSSILEPI